VAAWSIVKTLLTLLLLPPGNGLLLLGLAAGFRRRRWAFALALGGGLLLLAQSLPVVAYGLIASLEERAGPVLRNPPSQGVIVVLGSGLNSNAAEYGRDTANERTLARLRYGALLARRHGLPLMVTGGRPPATAQSEAEVMSDILQREFATQVRWQETTSRDTAENARYSAAILRAAGIDTVILVTHAFHMPRARLLFEKAGLKVIAAPTAFKAGNEYRWAPTDWLPQIAALDTTYFALHEWLGIIWTRLAR